MTDSPPNTNDSMEWPGDKNSGSNRGPRSFAILVLFAVAALMFWQSFMPVESAVAWQDDLEAAKQEAKQNNQRILIAFSSNACMYCRKMEANVFPQEEVLKAVYKFVPVKLDVNKEVQLSDRYHVGALPAYVVIDAEGNPVGKIDGYREADDMIRFLTAALTAEPATDIPDHPSRHL